MMRHLLSLVIFLFLVGVFHQGCTESRIPEQAEIKFDIQGDWEITMIEADMFKFKRYCTFVGTKKSGTVVPTEGDSGTYNAGGEHGIAVEFFFWTYYPDGQKVFEYYLGNFIDENYMEGTGSYKEEEVPYPYRTPFAWGAHRIN